MEAKLTSDRPTLARRFLEPSNAAHRQYEALRAFFVDGVPSAQAAAQFGYTPGSFRVLVHQFRNVPRASFFMRRHQKGDRSATRRGYANKSSPCGNKTCRSMISAARWPMKVSR
jgi:hypothetical protein